MYRSTATWRPVCRCTFMTAHILVFLAALSYDPLKSSGTWNRISRQSLPDISKERGVFETSECGYPMTRCHVPAELNPQSQHLLIRSSLCPVTRSHDHVCRDFVFSQCRHFICSAHATCSADLILIFELLCSLLLCQLSTLFSDTHSVRPLMRATWSFWDSGHEIVYTQWRMIYTGVLIRP